MKKAGKTNAISNGYAARNNCFDQRTRLFICPVMLLLFLLAVGCANPSLKANKAVANQTAENEIPIFERDLETLRTANFDYIFAFRRKDGGAFDGEDKKYLRANLPYNNRVLLTDENKAVIVGSNYKFPPEKLETLANRFNIENFSPKKEESKPEPK